MGETLKPDVETVHFWSDGSAAQFKSKYCFELMASYNPAITITWSYFESHHGKGPVDGIGGSVKSTVYRNVKAGKKVINNAKESADYADCIINNINVIYVDEKLIKPPSISGDYDVPGTQKIYHVQRAVGRNSVLLRFYHNSIFLNSNSGENPFRVVTYARNIVPTTKPCQASAEEPPHVVLAVNDISEVQLNEFLSVIYDGKWWIGTAGNISPENQDVQLSFLHPHGPRTHFHWPDLDLCWIKVDDIIGSLMKMRLKSVEHEISVSLSM